MKSNQAQWLVFTDMDGSLLDHDNYQFEAARPCLKKLAQAGIPVIANTSKTRAELVAIRQDMDNHHPFISENGAAVYIPLGYFPEQPADTQTVAEYWVKTFSAPRGYWLELLQTLTEEFGSEFRSFSAAGIKGIVEMTGLSEPQAALAAAREFSEPVQWTGSDARYQAFFSALELRGCHPVKGGRFIHLCGDFDKSSAMLWLQEEYRQQRSKPQQSLAIGDGENDVAMLEAADFALLIRSPAHAMPALSHRHTCIRSTLYGPEAWAYEVNKLIFSSQQGE